MPSSYTLTATERKPQQGIVVGKGDAHNLRVLLTSTVEFTAGASGRTIKWGKIPSNARLSGSSRVYNDDCSTNTSNIDFGLDQSNNTSITADPDAIGNSTATLGTASAAGQVVLTDPATIGIPAWDLINGVSSDPGGDLDVYSTLTDGATTTTGTVTLELLGYLD